MVTIEEILEKIPERHRKGISPDSGREIYELLRIVVKHSDVYPDLRPAALAIASCGKVAYKKEENRVILGTRRETYPGACFYTDDGYGVMFDKDFSNRENDVAWFHLNKEGKYLHSADYYQKLGGR